MSVQIKAIGKISKKCYCNNCFSIISWDSADAELTTFGHRHILCPKCGNDVDIAKAIVDYDNVIAEPKAIINGIASDNAEKALTTALQDESIKEVIFSLEQPLTLSTSILVPDGKKLTLDLNGQDITTGRFGIAAYDGSELTITGEGSIAGSGRQIFAMKGSTVNIEGGLIKSTGDSAIQGREGAVINISGGEVEAQEFGVIVFTGAKVNVSGGKLVTHDNAVIGGNGSPGQGGTAINITGGELVGSIQSAGYVACGIYVPNEGTFTMSGGKITANGGAGIVARGGKVSISGGEIIATGDASITGKVGDSRVVVPCSGIVYDKNSKYPGVESLNVHITGGKITGSKSSIEVLTTEENPKIKVSKAAILTPPYEG